MDFIDQHLLCIETAGPEENTHTQLSDIMAMTLSCADIRIRFKIAFV